MHKLLKLFHSLSYQRELVNCEFAEMGIKKRYSLPIYCVWANHVLPHFPHGGSSGFQLNSFCNALIRLSIAPLYFPL